MCKKKKEEVIKMNNEITYKVEARCNKAIGINVEFKGIGDINTAFECAVELSQAFPDVLITCEQTGEIMYNRYVALDFFKPSKEMGAAIFKAEFDMYL
jgi:hypothetical protein